MQNMFIHELDESLIQIMFMPQIKKNLTHDQGVHTSVLISSPISDMFTLKICSYLGQIGQNDLPQSWTVLGDSQNTVICDAVRTPTQVYLPQIRAAHRHL